MRSIILTLAGLGLCGLPLTSWSTPLKASTPQGTAEATPVPAEIVPPLPTGSTQKPASVATLPEEEIKGFAEAPPALQSLVRKALALTRQNLTYQYGSADPKSGGMDCSGAVYYVLQNEGLHDVPRQSDLMCRWVMRHAVLYRTESVAKFTDLPFSAIQPGDLVFWTGTSSPVSSRFQFISHVMIYLGKRKKDDKPLLFGSSEGRSYDGEHRNGVSLFDFKVPPPGAKGSIFGYGRVPGLNLGVVVRKAIVP